MSDNAGGDPYPNVTVTGYGSEIHYIQVHPDFVLSAEEQAELRKFLWPQWINPNEFPALKGLMIRLDKAAK